VSTKKVTKSKQAQAATDSNVLVKAKAFKLDDALAGVTKTQTQLQDILAGVQKEVIAKVADLETLEQAIELKKQEMATLHGAEKILLTIDELQIQHDATIDRLGKERDEIVAKNKDLKVELEVTRTREEANFQYERSQRHKLEDDQWAEKVRIRSNQERDRIEAFEKDLANRESVLASKEKEYNEALAKAATFDAELDKRVNAEVGREKGILTSKFEADKRLIDVQHKAEVDGLKKDIEHATKTATAKDLEIASLKEQLAKALEAQTVLAKATVESATNTKALADAQALITNVGGSNGQRVRS